MRCCPKSSIAVVGCTAKKNWVHVCKESWYLMKSVHDFYVWFYSCWQSNLSAAFLLDQNRMLFANLCGIWCAASFCPPLDHNLETQLTGCTLHSGVLMLRVVTRFWSSFFKQMWRCFAIFWEGQRPTLQWGLLLIWSLSIFLPVQLAAFVLFEGIDFSYKWRSTMCNFSSVFNWSCVYY